MDKHKTLKSTVQLILLACKIAIKRLCQIKRYHNCLITSQNNDLYTRIKQVHSCMPLLLNLLREKYPSLQTSTATDILLQFVQRFLKTISIFLSFLSFSSILNFIHCIAIQGGGLEPWPNDISVDITASILPLFIRITASMA